MIRAVIDTNILIRAIIRPLGTIGPITRRLRQREYRLVLSPQLADELVSKLREPRFERKYGITEERIQIFLDELVVSSEIVSPTRVIDVCRDQDDNRVLEAAVDGDARYIVTSDEDLLVLDPFEGIRIIKPYAFLKLLDQ